MNKEQITEAINNSYAESDLSQFTVENLTETIGTITDKIMAIKENEICPNCNFHESNPAYGVYLWCQELHINVKKDFCCNNFRE